MAWTLAGVVWGVSIVVVVAAGLWRMGWTRVAAHARAKYGTGLGYVIGVACLVATLMLIAPLLAAVVAWDAAELAAERFGRKGA